MHKHRSGEIVEGAAHTLAEHFHIRQPSRSATAVRLHCPAYDSTAATSVKLPMTDTTGNSSSSRAPARNSGTAAKPSPPRLADLDPGPRGHRGVPPQPRHHRRRGRLPDPSHAAG